MRIEFIEALKYRQGELKKELEIIQRLIDLAGPVSKPVSYGLPPNLKPGQVVMGVLKEFTSPVSFQDLVQKVVLKYGLNYSYWRNKLYPALTHLMKRGEVIKHIGGERARVITWSIKPEPPKKELACPIMDCIKPVIHPDITKYCPDHDKIHNHEKYKTL